MFTMSGDLAICQYCNLATSSWECVSQIPVHICPQDFITRNVCGFDGNLLIDSDAVCIKHETVFNLKYKCFKQGGSFSRQYKANVCDEKEEKCCYCMRNAESLRMISKMDVAFQEFLIAYGTQRVTRKGTGISDDNLLCSRCYQCLRKKYKGNQEGVYYSPKKPLRGNSKNSSVESSFCMNSPKVESSQCSKEIELETADEESVCVKCGVSSSKKMKKKLRVTDSVYLKLLNTISIFCV